MTKEEWDAYLTEIFPPEIQGIKRPEEPIPADLEFCARLLQLMREDPVDAVLINAILRQILSNDRAIASHFSGTEFPTENLAVGMECYRTDEEKKYRLISTEPVIWDVIPGAVEIPLVAGKNIKVTKNAASKAVTVAVNGTVDSAKLANAAWYLAQNTIANGTDLNTLQDEGGYICISNASASSLLHSPTSEAFGMYVENTGAGVIQILKKYSTVHPGMMFRTLYDGAWSEWREIATTASKVLEAENADTATKLQTARTINGVAFDGSANITVTAAADGGTATNVSGGTANVTSITSSNGRIETTGTSINMPQVLWHIPGVNYSRIRMDTDGTLLLQNGGSDNYVSIKAANFIGHLTGSADSIGGIGSDQICISRGTASGDLNNLYTPGVYQVTPETNTNWPAGAYNYGILFVYAPHGSTYGGALSQMYISHRNGIYTRSGGWGTLNWTEWSQLIGCNLSGHLVLPSGSEIWVE